MSRLVAALVVIATTAGGCRFGPGPDVPTGGPRTGVSIPAEVSGVPRGFEIIGSPTCYELDLHNGGFGAEVVVSMVKTLDGAYRLSYVLEVESSGAARQYRSRFEWAQGALTEETFLFPLGFFEREMIEIPKGLKSCSLTFTGATRVID